MPAKTTEKNTPDTLPVDTDATLVPAVLPNALQRAETGAPIVAADDDWADVSDGDLAPEEDQSAFDIPLLPLNRKLDGGFTNPDTGETQVRTLDFIWLARGYSRAWWKEPFGKGDAAPGCRSADAVKADPNSPDLQNGGDCSTCPHAQWHGDEAPECKKAMEALIFISDDHGLGQLARVRLGGIAFGPAKAFWDSFSARLPRRPPIAFMSRVELVETDTKNGRFLAPRFTRVHELTRAQAAPLIEERDRRLEAWRKAVEADVASAGRDDDESGPFDGGGSDTAATHVCSDPDEEPF